MSIDKPRIKLLRGDASAESNKTKTLKKGQPLFDTSSNHLYVGDGESTIEALTPVRSENNNIIFYCETASDVSKKAIDIPNYKLFDGQRAFIQFENDNESLIPPTLNINKVGDKDIYFNGKSLNESDGSINNLTGYSFYIKNMDSFGENFKLNFYYESKYYTNLIGGDNITLISGGVSTTIAKKDIKGKTFVIVGGEQVTNKDLILFMKTPTNGILFPTNNIKGNILYQLEYKNDAFYINDLKTTNSTYKSVLLYNNLTGLNIGTNNILKPIDIMDIDTNTKKNIDYFIILCSDRQEGDAKELNRFTLQISPGDGDRYSLNQNNILLKQDEETESDILNVFTFTQVNFILKKREEKYVIQGISSLRKMYIDGSKPQISEPYPQYVLQIYGVTETEK